MKSFRSPEIGQLARELALSPQRLRLRQVLGLLRAVEIIDPTQEYPFSFVCFQITGYHTRHGDDVLLEGRLIVEDLVELAETLTKDAPIRVSAAQGIVHTAEALARRFKVSPKTISRWRGRGLVGCWLHCGDEAARIGFLPRAVQGFVGRNLELVRRGAAFKLMRGDEKARIIARAREIVATEQATLHGVTLRLAEETGRAVETIRYTLRRYDLEHPDQALFDQTEKPQPIDENEVIYQAHVDGEPLGRLARRFGKSQKQIVRILTLVRAKELAGRPIDYISNEDFDDPDAAERIVSAPPGDGDEAEEDPISSRLPSGLPAYLQELYRTPLLTAGAERHLFRQMNYLLHRAELKRREIAANPAAATQTDLAEVDARLAQATAVKNRITQANLRLVVSIAKRHLASSRSANLFELISDGNLALMRAVEKFDYARGFRFSTYASWAIMRSFARSVPEAITHSERYRTGQEEILASTRDLRVDDSAADSRREGLRARIAAVMESLEDRERLIVARHFGLQGADAPQTLDEIGRAFRISKERVRQIEIRALRKLRSCLSEQAVELLAG